MTLQLQASNRVLLVDNGSLEPESTLKLRELAAALAVRLKCAVVPTSLAHSGKISPEKLGGAAAELFEAALDRVLAEGAQRVVVVPVFIGPSHAVVRVLPALVAERKARHPSCRFALAQPLFGEGDSRLAEILADHVRETVGADARLQRVAVVDHGSPNAAVTEVRNAVAARLRNLLGASVAEVQPCSMERREGAEYDFNDPLLAKLLTQKQWSVGPTIVAMLFLFPGRHAGPHGDVAQICDAARTGESALRMTKLLGEHPRLVDILEDRARNAVNV